MARRLATACASGLLVLLLTFPAAVQAQFNYTTNNGTLTITGYSGPAGAVTIPSSANGLPVTSIAEQAFFFAGVTSVSIPGSVTSLGGYAFGYCTSLRNVYFEGNAPTSLNSLTLGTVFTGDSTTAYYLPGATGWGSSFAGVPAMELAAITLTANPTNGAVPLTVNFTFAGVDSAGNTVSNWNWTFGDGSTSTARNPSHTYTNSGTFSVALFETNNHGGLIAGSAASITVLPLIVAFTANPTNGFVPFTVSFASPGVDNGGNTISNWNWTFGDGSTSTAQNPSHTYTNSGTFSLALIGTNNLGETVIGAGPASILAGQVQFTYTNTNGTLTIIGYTDTGSGGAVTVPSSANGLPVTSIGAFAFADFTNMTSVLIPNSVTNIGAVAFVGCTSLTSVTIPNSVTSIGEGAFSSCSTLTAITVDTLNSVYSSVAGVVFDKSRTTLIAYPGGEAGSYTIPNSVTSIGAEAFDGCTGLTNITIPDSVTNIGVGAFNLCISLTSVTLPDSVASIGEEAFSDCWGLTSVTIGNGVTSIGAEAFQFCSALASATIPNSVTSIAEGAFQFCSALASVTIPSRVTSIAEGAFDGCTSLTSVTIPNSVTSIGELAVSNCHGLTSVYFEGNAPSFGTNVFYDDSDLTVYYLPGTTGWAGFYAVTGLTPVLWNPQVQTPGASFGVRTNQFGFTVTAGSSLVVVVEASTNLANPTWYPLATNTLTSGSFYFSDPQWTNYSSRFYRLRWP
jgi:PKD repeat protein